MPRKVLLAKFLIIIKEKIQIWSTRWEWKVLCDEMGTQSLSRSGSGPQHVWLQESMTSRALSLLMAVNPLANLEAPPHLSQVDPTSPNVRVFIRHFSGFASDCFGVTQPFSCSNMKEASSSIQNDSLTVQLDHLPDSTCRHHVQWWLSSHPRWCHPTLQLDGIPTDLGSTNWSALDFLFYELGWRRQLSFFCPYPVSSMIC